MVTEEIEATRLNELNGTVIGRERTIERRASDMVGGGGGGMKKVEGDRNRTGEANRINRTRMELLGEHDFPIHPMDRQTDRQYEIVHPVSLPSDPLLPLLSYLLCTVCWCWCRWC